MNRAKYRIWLIGITVAAIVFGVVYYIWIEKKEKAITEGTFVYRIEQEERKIAA